MLVIVAAILAAGAVALLLGVDTILSWAVHPSVLLALLVLDIALVAFRVFSVVDAYGAGAGTRTETRTSRVVAGVTLAIILLFTIAPHAVGGYYIYLSRDLITTVFADEQPVTTSTYAHMSTTPTLQTTTTSPSPTSVAASTSTVRTTSTTTPPETVAPIDSGDDARLTILLIGSDAGYGRSGARADSIMVATVDLVTGQPALLGIPRNTGSVPLSDAASEALGLDVYENLISSLYLDARDHPELAPEDGDAGAVTIRDTVSMLLGIPVDYYAVVDMGGFVDLVDAFGGVKINVKERLNVRLSPPTPEDEWRIYDIEPGIQELSGLEALAFARSRTGTDDYDRMRRQRCVLGALLDQNGPAEMLFRFPKIVKAIRESLRTDIPIDRLQDLIRIRDDIRTDRLITVGFAPPDYITGRNRMGYNILDLDLVQTTVRQIIENPDAVLSAMDPETVIDDSDCWRTD